MANLIVESGKNCTDAHMTEGMFGEEDLHFLLDFDMAFLGSEPSKYDAHCVNIRKEYAHLSDEDYADQRLKVILSISYSLSSSFLFFWLIHERSCVN